MKTRKNIMKIAIPHSKACRLLAATIIGLLLASATANAGIIFQADFNGPGGGTGGSSDLVTLGGTGAITADGVNMIADVTNSAPFSAGSSNYLNEQYVSGGVPAPVTFTFASDTNSLLAWQGSNVFDVADNIQATVLHAAFDTFLRVNSGSGPARDLSGVRPLDTVSWGGGGSDGLRIILNCDDGGSLIFKLLVRNYVSGNPPAVLNLTANPGSGYVQYGNNYVQLAIDNWGTTGQVYHVGFTLDTDTNGLTTMLLFGKNGTGAIGVPADALVSASFNLDSASVGNAFVNVPWIFGGGYNSDGEFNMDYDTVRLYDSAPDTFAALPGVTAPPQHGLIFEADFNGPGGGTGGTNDLVTVGGSGVLNVDGSGSTGTVLDTNLLGANGGSYLNTVIPNGWSDSDSPVTFNFASDTNSWIAWQGLNIIAGGTNYTQLHGAYDLFVRPDVFAMDTPPGDSGWFRPVDGASWNSGGAGSIRVILQGQGDGDAGLRLLIISENSGGFLNYSNINGSSYSPNRLELDGGDILTAGPGQVYHTGFTFDTDTNSGVITAKLFFQQGAGAIDTSDATGVPVASATFQLNADVVGSVAFVNAPYNFNVSGYTDANGSDGATFDVDSVRLYDQAPNSFRALGAPLPGTLQFLPPTVSGGQITLTWIGSGQLQWASAITGPWTNITGASSPYSESIVPGQNRFYRLVGSP